MDLTVQSARHLSSHLTIIHALLPFFLLPFVSLEHESRLERRDSDLN